MSLVPVDTSSELAVTSYLQQARDWLAQAVETTGPEQIANAKAEIATAAEATRQLGLSQEIRSDAVEMVRRAEYALARAIRKGQSEGMIRTQSDNDRDASVPSTKASPSDFASDVELYDRPTQGKAGILSIADNATPEQFEKALSQARAEGNLSRANVARKVKQETQPNTRSARADVIADLASQGYSSRQMPAKVGVSEESIRRIARDFDIEISADKIVGRSRRIDHTHIVESTVYGLEDTVSAIGLIEFTEVDPADAGEWVTSLSNSLKELARFLKQIKEMTHA